MKVLVLFAIVAAMPAHAQNVVAIHMQGQPLIYTDQGMPTGCGLRIVGVIDPVAPGGSVRTFDISANMWASGAALGKVIGEVNVVQGSNKLKGSRQPLHGAWFRSAGGQPVASVAQTFAPSPTDRGAYTFPASSSAVADFLTAVVKGHSALVGLRWQQGIEAIYSGDVQLRIEERQQIAGCLSQVFK